MIVPDVWNGPHGGMYARTKGVRVARFGRRARGCCVECGDFRVGGRRLPRRARRHIGLHERRGGTPTSKASTRTRTKPTRRSSDLRQLVGNRPRTSAPPSSNRWPRRGRRCSKDRWWHRRRRDRRRPHALVRTPARQWQPSVAHHRSTRRKAPGMTPQAQKREAAIAALNDARNGEGRADSWLDRSMYDRCITRGLPGSMMPAIYGNAYQIVQAPGYVAIRYEMIHETRVIPLDGRPHVGPAIREIPGRRARALGRQHARRRDDQLHGPDALRLQQPIQQPDIHAHRTLHTSGSRHAAVAGDVQRSRGLDAAVHVCHASHARQ